MTERVSELVTLSLVKPIRVSVDPFLQTSKKLIQEFTKIRKNSEEERDAVLLTVCTNTFKKATIIFFQHKVDAHRMRVIFGLSGLSAAELHGDLNQVQRLDALEDFRDGKVNYLLATDIASRGLDIIGIESVINYMMPNTEEIYVHRVGRTARAGKKGRALSLIGETGYERKMLKSIVKHSPPNSCKNRVVSRESINYWKKKLSQMKTALEQVAELEKAEKAERKLDMELEKAENVIKHREEIHSRPAREWFLSTKEKTKIKSEEKRIIEELTGAREKEQQEKEQDEVKAEEEKDEEKKHKVYRPAPVPTITPLPSRRERRVKEAQATMLSPAKYNLAKKKNQKTAHLQKKKPRKAAPTSGPKKTIKKFKKGGTFKSKKRHKRR